MTVKGLILSIFPGIDILGRAFEEEGYCVVRGPDKLWGGDIKLFHPPTGVFEGIIAGPPCQEFSITQKINRGKPSKWGNLIPEFERVVSEAQPEWFVMENIKRAPIPKVDGYHVDPTLLNSRWLGMRQHRVHRFSFGTKSKLRLSYDIALFEHQEWAPRVMASGVVKDFQHFKGNKNMHLHGYRSNKNLRICLALQGLPEDLLDDSPFTVDGKFGCIGNAVSYPQAQTLARAVRRAMNGHKNELEAIKPAPDAELVHALPADPLAELVIHTATDGEKQHSFKLGETEVRGKTLRGCILALGKHMGWGSTAATILENLRNLPASQNSELLISILEGDNA